MLRLFDKSKADNNNKQEIIFVMGGPGSGKGTQCNLLEKSKNYYHISTGDIIRNMLKENTGSDDPVINKIRDAMKNGVLLDDTTALDVVKREMQAHPEVAGFLIDGYPRTIKQLSIFEEYVKPCDRVLFFDTTEEIMRQRTLGRAEIEHREDDNEVVIARRIKTFKTQTMLVINELARIMGDKFIRIDTSGTVEEVNKAIEQALNQQPGMRLAS